MEMEAKVDTSVGDIPSSPSPYSLSSLSSLSLVQNHDYPMHIHKIKSEYYERNSILFNQANGYTHRR